jgi:hypothetical protein
MQVPAPMLGRSVFSDTKYSEMYPFMCFDVLRCFGNVSEIGPVEEVVDGHSAPGRRWCGYRTCGPGSPLPTMPSLDTLYVSRFKMSPP